MLWRFIHWYIKRRYKKYLKEGIYLCDYTNTMVREAKVIKDEKTKEKW